MIKETFNLKGSLVIKKNGKVEREIPNAVIGVGRDWVIKRMLQDHGTGDYKAMTHMAVGYKNWDGINDVPDNESALASEQGRVAFTATGNGITTPVDSGGTRILLQFVANFPAGTASTQLTEAGIFNNATSGQGTMLCRTKFAVINKGADDTLEITWKIEVS